MNQIRVGLDTGEWNDVQFFYHELDHLCIAYCVLLYRTNGAFIIKIALGLYFKRVQEKIVL